jgi:hypothetical protein
MGIWGFTLSCANALLGKYGVTANSIGPGAATRMTATVPGERRPSGVRDDPDAVKGTDRDPANVAVPLVYLASDEGGWINGRCFGVSGYRVTLYSQISLPGRAPGQRDVDHRRALRPDEADLRGGHPGGSARPPLVRPM